VFPDVNPDERDEAGGGFERVLVGKSDDGQSLHLLVHPGRTEGGREGKREGGRHGRVKGKGVWCCALLSPSLSPPYSPSLPPSFPSVN